MRQCAELAHDVRMHLERQAHGQPSARGAVSARVFVGDFKAERGAQGLHACDRTAATAIGVQSLREEGPESDKRRADAAAAVGSLASLVRGQRRRQHILKEHMQLSQTKLISPACMTLHLPPAAERRPTEKMPMKRREKLRVCRH